MYYIYKASTTYRSEKLDRVFKLFDDNIEESRGKIALISYLIGSINVLLALFCFFYNTYIIYFKDKSHDTQGIGLAIIIGVINFIFIPALLVIMKKNKQNEEKFEGAKRKFQELKAAVLNNKSSKEDISEWESLINYFDEKEYLMPEKPLYTAANEIFQVYLLKHYPERLEIKR